MNRLCVSLSLVLVLIQASLATAKPNLKWTSTDIAITPAGPLSGQIVTFEASFKCKRQSADNVHVEAMIDGVQVWSHTYPHLDQGQVKQVTVPWSATAGDHSVAMIIDPAGTIPETKEWDNTLERHFSVGLSVSRTMGRRPDVGAIGDRLRNRPDLRVFLSYTPRQPSTSYETTFNVRVNNDGNGGSGPTTVLVWLQKKGGPKILHRTIGVPAIKEGGVETLSFKHHFTLYQLGEYEYGANVDIGNTVHETDENNNTAVAALEVVDARPDLIVSDLVTMQKFRVGRKATVWGKVKNMGPLQSGPFNLHMICSGDKNREKRIPSLPRDAEWRFEFNFEYWFARSVRCKATVDKDNEVDERNEGNNERQISFKVILN